MRLSRASVERHTSQSQPMTGTPCEVPVPKNVNIVDFGIIFSRSNIGVDAFFNPNHITKILFFGDFVLKSYFCNTIFYKTIMAYKISDSCVACGTCIDECPVEAISAGDIYVIDPDKCIECGACAGVCPSEAISL